MIYFKKSKTRSAFFVNYALMLFFLYFVINLAMIFLFNLLNLEVLPHSPGRVYYSSSGSKITNYAGAKSFLVMLFTVFGAIWLYVFLLNKRDANLGKPEAFPEGNPYLSDAELELQAYEKKMNSMSKQEKNVLNEELF